MTREPLEALVGIRGHDSVCAAAVDVSVDSQTNARFGKDLEELVILFRQSVDRSTIDDREKDSHRKLLSLFVDSEEMNLGLMTARTRRARVVEMDERRLTQDSYSIAARRSPERGLRKILSSLRNLQQISQEFSAIKQKMSNLF